MPSTETKVAIRPRTKRSSLAASMVPRTAAVPIRNMESGVSSDACIATSFPPLRGNGPNFRRRRVAQSHFPVGQADTHRLTHIIRFHNNNFAAWRQVALMQVGEERGRLALGHLGHPR